MNMRRDCDVSTVDTECTVFSTACPTPNVLLFFFVFVFLFTYWLFPYIETIGLGLLCLNAVAACGFVTTVHKKVDSAHAHVWHLPIAWQAVDFLPDAYTIYRAVVLPALSLHMLANNRPMVCAFGSSGLHLTETDKHWQTTLIHDLHLKNESTTQIKKKIVKRFFFFFS